jgi:hypothetical protein
MDGMIIERGPVFVVGNQKSGTTLLASLLDSHPDIVALPLEIKLFYFAPLPTLPPGNLPTEKQSRVKTPLREYITPDRVKDEVISSYDFETLRSSQTIDRNISSLQESVDVDRFLREIRRREAQKLSDIFEIIFSSWAEAQLKPLQRRISDYVWVEKTPNQEEYASRLKKWFPNAIFLHVLRNPYANVFSLARSATYSKPHHLLLGTGKMRDLRSEVFGLTAKSFYFLERNLGELDDYHAVKFENLVLHTEDVMRSICELIDIPFNRILLQPTICGRPWGGNSRTSEGDFEGVDQGPVDAYRPRISNLELRLVNAYFDAFMARHEYAVEETPSVLKCLMPIRNEGLFSYLLNRYLLFRDSL